MAENFSSRKVARVARTGGSRRRGGFNSSSYGWYAILVVIVVLGTALIWLSRQERLDASNPGSTPPLAPSEAREGDYWYEALGVYICDKFVPNINNDANPYGISTKNDGVIYIHPFERKYAGHNANLGLFSKAVGMKVDSDSVQLPNDAKVYGPGEKCGDKEGELVVKEWTDAKNNDSSRRVRGDLKSLLLKNGSAITIAFVPKETADIPLPPSAASLDAIAAADAATRNAPPETVPPTAEESTTTTTAAPPTSAPAG